MSALFKVRFNEKDKIVITQVFGEAKHEDHYAALDEALRMCHKKDCPRLLVDLRDLNTVHSSTMQCFSFGEALAQRSRGIRLAHVLPVSAKSREDVRFTSTVGFNQGVVTREFQDIEDAKKWLLGLD